MRMTLQGLRGLFNSLFMRVILIVLGGLLVSQLASIWLQSGERTQAISVAQSENFADRIAEVIRLLEATPQDLRAATVTALQSESLHVQSLRAEEVSPTIPRGQMQALIAQRLGGFRELRSANAIGMRTGFGGMRGMGGMDRGSGNSPQQGEVNPALQPQAGNGMQRYKPQRSFDVQLVDGQWYRIITVAKAVTPTLPPELIGRLLISLLVVLVIVMLAVRQLSRPLQQLASAADTLGRDLAVAPLPEKGSVEMRQAAHAFNRMQARLRHLLDERARALAAVSHDLRTPLTRLRLRTELIDDDKLRNEVGADLDAMVEMLDATLDYLRSLKDTEKLCRIDINALLQSLCEDGIALGRAITLEGTTGAPYSGKLSALRRAIQNLLDNAIKYGGSAHIHVSDDTGTLFIRVEDEGPGIPREELPRIMEPYYRPDASRNSATGGVGLGLSIVRDIAVLHGGELCLENRSEGGLRATLVLPRN